LGRRSGVLFGRVDDEPVLDNALMVGDEFAVSYDKFVEHRKAADFQKQ
jgi:hypothetical protein